MKILLKLWGKGSEQPIIRHSANPRRMAQLLGRASWQKAYLKVAYPQLKDQYTGGMPDNEGFYFNEQDLKRAFRAFTEQ